MKKFYPTFTNIFKIITLFCLGGFLYLCVELLYRGYTHWTMFFLGGLCFVVCGLVNNLFSFEMPVVEQLFICSLAVTAFEFIFGVILNLWLQLNIWDYSNIPFNVMGQICLPFSIAWYFLSFIAIIVDDFIRWKVFNEECPHYHLFVRGEHHGL